MDKKNVSGKIKVLATRTVKEEGLDQVLELYGRLAEESRKEAGNIAYDVFQDLDNPGFLVVIEEWENQAALDAHFLTPHFTEIVPLMKEKSLGGEVRRLGPLF